MSPIALEIIFILLLLIANGVFAMTEIAVVSTRKARLRRLAEAAAAGAGGRGHRAGAHDGPEPRDPEGLRRGVDRRGC